MEKIKSDDIIQDTEKKETKTNNSASLDVEAMLVKMQKQIQELAADKAKQAEIIEKQSKALEALSTSHSGNAANSDLVELLKGLQESRSTKMVKVIFLDDVAQGMFKLQNGRTVKFVKDSPMDTTYGKIVPLSEDEAMLLLNEYADTFARGALKFDEDHMYMLEEKGIDISKINYKPMESISKFASMTNEEIKSMYDSFKYWQKDMLKSYIVGLIKKNEVSEDLVDKIKYLNRLTREESFGLNKEGDFEKRGSYDLILQRLKDGGLE